LGGIKRERLWGALTNVECKSIWSCHNESLLYNDYILIKNQKDKKYESKVNSKTETNEL
jgi:hypothetical protein